VEINLCLFATITLIQLGGATTGPAHYSCLAVWQNHCIVKLACGDGLPYAGCWLPLLLLLQDLLSDRSRVLQVVLDEARAVAAKHGVPRRSRIMVRHDVCCWHIAWLFGWNRHVGTK
jgi:hypothetical protein